MKYIVSSALLAVCVASSTGWQLPTARPGPFKVAVVDWRIDNVDRIGGHAVEPIGSPRVVATDIGAAVEFNGQTDGLRLDVNPLEGLSTFTIEVLFSPAADGIEEQRFLHVQERTGENRALIELRILPGAKWCLDTFLRFDTDQRTLIDRFAEHPTNQWHVASLTYDGVTMAHFVDGRREGSGAVSFKPLAAGRTSIGVRQDLRSWFKGRIRHVRVTPEALTPNRLLTKIGA